jgi:hypothetical protein
VGDADERQVGSVKEKIQQCALAFWIEGSSRFVEHHDVRIVQEHTRKPGKR